jgi:hypothetical protein
LPHHGSPFADKKVTYQIGTVSFEQAVDPHKYQPGDPLRLAITMWSGMYLRAGLYSDL